MLDVDPPRLGSLTIEGRLIAAERDLRLEAKNIVVHGAFSIGTAHGRFAHRARIVLDASADGAGVLLVANGGSVSLWGAERRSWTRLTRTIERNTRDVELSQSVDWQSGDRIVLAPSGFDANEAEEAIVGATSGARIRLAAPVRFRHWGTVTNAVDERAEVGLITHNIVVTSEPAAARQGIGGQVMAMQGGRLDINGVEFDALGQRGKLGRYPLHFHLAGDARSSTIAASSIVHSFNRCLTIHGTSNVTVRDNVAYATSGHCFFLEDGIETGNVIAGNLALATGGAKLAGAILESDINPASFGSRIRQIRWSITLPPVATVTAFGITSRRIRRVRQPMPASGPAKRHWASSAAMLPIAMPATVCSSTSYATRRAITEAPNYDPAVTADFTAFTAYKNRKRGAWLRGTNLRLSNAVIADNSIGVTFAGANAILRDSRIVGTTQNETGPPKLDDSAFPIRGFEFYDGQVGVERTGFVNFVGNAARHASALSALRFSPFFTDPTNYARALTFDNAQAVYFEPQAARRDKLGADGYRGSVFRDLDGSVTGAAGTSVAVDTPLLASGECTSHASWNAMVCGAPFGSVFVIGVGMGARTPGPVRVSLVALNANLTRKPPIDPLHSMLLFGNPDRTVDAIFQTNVRANQTYSVYFRQHFPAHVRVGLHHFNGGDRVTLIFPQAPADMMLANGRARAGTVLTRRADGTLELHLSTQRAGGGHGANVIDLCTHGACS